MRIILMPFFLTNYKSIFSLFIMLLITCSVNGASLQWTTQPSQIETAILQSKITQKNYRIYSSIPQVSAPNSGYPVIYMLDAHLTFPIAAYFSQLLLKLGMITPIIVVGIDYSDESQWAKLRASDYTPPHNAKPIREACLKGEDIGGHAGQFLQVINNEIKPVIEQKYTIDKTKQALFGHSYGGLFTLYVFLTKPDSFNYYFAASPSIWWDDHVILQKLETFIKQPTNSQNISLIISVGELEQKITNNLSKQRKEKLLKRKQVTNAKFFINKVTELNNSNIHSQFILFAEQNHATVIPFAIQQALLSFFHNTKSSHSLNQ